MLWVYQQLPREKRSALLYARVLSLVLIPFVKMGEWGDFCMRCSIPALLVLSVLVAKEALRLLREKKLYLAAGLAFCLLLTSIGPLKEIDDAVDATVWGGMVSYENIMTTQEYFGSSGYVRYQYVDWEPDGWARYILQP